MELEYTIERENEFSLSGYVWEDTVIGISGVTPLTGFKIKCRAVDPPELPEGEPTYPQWRVISQTLTSSKPLCGTIPFANATEDFDSGIYAEAGITDGSGYIYVRTFDLTRFAYLPAFSGENQDTFTGEVDAITGFPETPYDPGNGVYPMDAVTKFSPDERPSVTITYTLTTEYIRLVDGTPIGDTGNVEDAEIEGESQTDTITITQTVLQPSFNWAAILFGLQAKTYFANGIYH